jgi:serine phosphatase RsbU (regulator of sigma subunit)
MKKKESNKEFSQSYVKNVFRIILLASVSISLAVIITGVLGYTNTKNSIIHKAKSQDIIFKVKSMASKIDGRISRAVETSYIFARDLLNIEWVRGGEKDEQIGKIVLKKLEDIANFYDYSNLFLVSVKTNRYYFRENSTDKATDNNYVILSENNPADKWFYDTLTAKKEMSFNVNYDRAMDDSFLFINTLMGNSNSPIGICGVGLSLKDIAKEFNRFKVGQQSSLWLIDEKGIIQLSDTRSDIGKKYEEFLPKEVLKDIGATNGVTQEIKVLQYLDKDNEIIDYAYHKLASCDWILFYKIPRSESISLISSLKINMILTVTLVLIFFMLLFYIISKKIANPYKQTMLMNMELERKINTRTQELKESNEKIMDSIQYAKRLQETILPSEQQLEDNFKDNFVIWRPKDIVGGDFFWLREFEEVTVLAIGDCTGHGVPGALMTMTVNAILHNIVTNVNRENPSIILKELHIQLRQTLNKTTNSQVVDDGLDIAIFCIKDKTNLLYSGANIELYIKNRKEVKLFKHQSKGVGYSYIEMKETLAYQNIEIQEGDIFIACTDGFIHQNGGQKNYPFGKKRLYNLIQECEYIELSEIKAQFEDTLKVYMNNEEQRDDITMIGFKIK